MDSMSLSMSKKLEIGITENDSAVFIAELKDLQASIKKLSSEPARLTGKTQELLSDSSESEKRERINLLDKTGEFAELQAKLATIASQGGHLKSGIKELEKNTASLIEEVANMKEPLVSVENDLNKLLEGRLKVESELLKARKAIEGCSESIHKIEREKIEKEQMAINLREALETLRLERQAAKIEAENIERQLIENDNKLDNLLEEINDEQTTQSLELELETVEKKISRLGAINLAAMEEYEVEEKRKSLLDGQHQELTDALETLQNAINKIDKPNANPDNVKTQLSSMNLLIEEWGGSIQSQDISAKTGENLDIVKALMENKVSVFSGHSGVGKSTLVNAIEPSLKLKTKEISDQHLQGQHTTTFAEMYDLSFDAQIIDTPGIKGFGMVEIDKEELSGFYPEFFKLKEHCKFHNCLHIEEPKCAVKEALENEEIAWSRYKSYLQILEGEEEHYRKDVYDKE
jgi:ribosome small subunit-dependent GTPase A